MPRVMDRVRLIETVTSEFTDRVHPVGTEGQIVERYHEPEMYSVTLEWANPLCVGGVEYDNVALQPSQFVVIDIEERNAKFVE
jgi:hypothetical protein